MIAAKRAALWLALWGMGLALFPQCAAEVDSVIELHGAGTTNPSRFFAHVSP